MASKLKCFYSTAIMPKLANIFIIFLPLIYSWRTKNNFHIHGGSYN